MSACGLQRLSENSLSLVAPRSWATGCRLLLALPAHPPPELLSTRRERGACQISSIDIHKAKDEQARKAVCRRPRYKRVPLAGLGFKHSWPTSPSTRSPFRPLPLPASSTLPSFQGSPVLHLPTVSRRYRLPAGCSSATPHSVLFSSRTQPQQTTNNQANAPADQLQAPHCPLSSPLFGYTRPLHSTLLSCTCPLRSSASIHPEPRYRAARTTTPACCNRSPTSSRVASPDCCIGRNHPPSAHSLNSVSNTLT